MFFGNSLREKPLLQLCRKRLRQLSKGRSRQIRLRIPLRSRRYRPTENTSPTTTEREFAFALSIPAKRGRSRYHQSSATSAHGTRGRWMGRRLLPTAKRDRKRRSQRG